MMDFIFNVDLSTVYIIVRRDFASAEDETGVASTPVGGEFYYSAEAAGQVARQYCLREAAKALNHMSESACHGQKDGMYWGGCITREPERDRFEVRVRRLKARGGPWRSSGETGASSVTVGGSRDKLDAVDGADGRWARASGTVGSRLTGSRAGRLWDSLTSTRRGRGAT